MDKYTPTIGLEIHAELKTLTKMFCNSKNDPDETEPNKNVCPVCMGHPGTLPTINKEAVKHVLKVGIALGGELANFTEFDRKNYFYPDIPKGYQISQYKYPLVKGGSLNNVLITRVHLEEDTATSIHDRGDYSLVDFNRAGVPLMELVTEPVIKEAKQAADFAKELQLLLQYLGVGEANLEKGEMRVEANISVSKDGTLGTKVEVKNLNSFKAVEKAINYEVKRHIELLEKGEKILQETRGWDEGKAKTFSQRTKESSHDYRYFPEPDLPKLYISEIPEFSIESLKKELPELPWEKRKYYKNEIGLDNDDVIEIFVSNSIWRAMFDGVCDYLKGNRQLVTLAANYIGSDLVGLYKNNHDGIFQLKTEHFVKLIEMIGENLISSRGAKEILKIMYNKSEDPEKIAEEKNLLQKSDTGELKKVIEKVIEDNPKVVEDYKNGKEASLQFLIGQGMKETKGSANPAVLKELFVEELKS